MQDKQDSATTPSGSDTDEKTISWKQFGPFLAKVRRARGLSQNKLAALLGCDRTFIWRLEHGDCRPSRMFLHHLALVFTLTAEEAANLKVYMLLIEHHLEELAPE